MKLAWAIWYVRLSVYAQISTICINNDQAVEINFVSLFEEADGQNYFQFRSNTLQPVLFKGEKGAQLYVTCEIRQKVAPARESKKATKSSNLIIVG